MRNTFLVMRHEIIKTFRSTAYVIFAFILPVVAVLILGVIKIIQANSVSEGVREEVSTANESQMEPEGFVDLSGIIQVIPEDHEDYLLSFETEEQAVQALAAGEITAYYVIPSDYLDVGDVFYVYPDTRSYLSDGQDWVISRTLITNLLESDPELANLVWNPVWFWEKKELSPEYAESEAPGDECSRPGGACETNELVRATPSIMVAIMYIAFMSTSSMLFNSVGVEKENRTIEVLLLSISPRQLLAGKTMGLGIAGLLQTIVWLGGIYISFNIGGSTMSLPDNFSFPVNILFWGLIFFFGGFGLYASLMAGAGAMVPKMKEAGVANFIALIPLLFGYVFGLIAPLAGNADSLFMDILSIFPLTSPVVMVMRITDGIVPLWQLLLSVLLLFITAYFTLRAVAAMFQAQNLLSGQPFSLRRYLKAFVGSR